MRSLAVTTIIFSSIFSSMAIAQAPPTVISLVKKAALDGDFATAQKELDQYKAVKGQTPEYMEAWSWIGRGHLAQKQYDAATASAEAVRKVALAQLAHRKVDDDKNFPIALGATIEVEAQAAAAQGRRDEAVAFLKGEIKRWGDTSMHARIQKNLLLLTLEGKPAPAIEVAHSVTDVRPRPLAAHKGHPVLVFFWAHWCPDCKAEASVLQNLLAAYGPKGFEIVAPTMHYGYVANGKDASREEESKYIADIYARYYARVGKIEVPVGEQTFLNYGVSTTPTVVLMDSKGIVRLYNPGRLSYEELAAKIEPLLNKGQTHE
jgi:thiol-disulfide isomerase/thioredoxin